ncbi:hypothetical protein BV25DRAFT_1469915 [Artomyces pyxidatus]|uniref:Uncharacterized protein n=1 Tax=Artomyces pyxidatus TaxID=48021 RepID=A0ACB8SLK9_9AGAM|nr:hypothetical protein BV25DRAFT_1469915 [Artomyces pyxidatus]
MTATCAQAPRDGEAVRSCKSKAGWRFFEALLTWSRTSMSRQPCTSPATGIYQRHVRVSRPGVNADKTSSSSRTTIYANQHALLITYHPRRPSLLSSGSWRYRAPSSSNLFRHSIQHPDPAAA